MIKKIACGISGGVDSAISAYLLKQKNYKVTGVFMTNWDEKDEYGYCTVEKDKEDAKYVCSMLDIEFREVNYVKEYWNHIFQYTIDSYKVGLTPNPDILCNREIKFNRFLNYCLNDLKMDYIATGHYARISYDSTNRPILMRSSDIVKDQTYWLSQIDVETLRHCIFPLSELTKSQVKSIATDIGLTRTLARKESMGMCFIGKRKFQEFIDLYVNPKHGKFKMLETEEEVGSHKGIHHYTLGQRSGLSLGSKSGFIAKINHSNQEIFIVTDPNHPALFMKKIYTSSPHWLGSDPLINENCVRLRMQYQNRYVSMPCTATKHKSGLLIELDDWFRCVVPGQYAVLYNCSDDICMGSALIIQSLSAYDENVPGPGHWDANKWDNQYRVAATASSYAL